MKSKMKAAVLYGPRDIRVESVDKPTIEKNTALVKIEACGICPTDVRGYTAKQSRSPFIPGHEWSGSIVEVGKEFSTFRIGDRVVPAWRVDCGVCYYCRRGLFNYCTNLNRNVVKGGFCEYGYTIASVLRLIPNAVSYKEASFTEPVACCVNGIRKCNIQMGDDVAVIGSGPIGLIHMQLAKRLGARVISIDLLKERLEMAKSLGADDTILASEEDPVSKIKEFTEGRGANAVIIAVGSQKPIEQGIEMAGPGASINVFAGTYPPVKIIVDPNTIHYGQISLTGSHDYTPHDFTVALKLIHFGAVRVKPLISHTFHLDRINEGFEIVSNRNGLKVIIRIP